MISLESYQTHYIISVKNLEEYLQVQHSSYKIFELYTYFRCFESLIPNKTTFTKCCLTQWISKLLGSFENPLSKTVPDKFQGFVRHSNYSCLQERANWQIVLNFDTVSYLVSMNSLMPCSSTNALHNYTPCLIWDVITHPCPNFNSSSTKPQLNLVHGYVITSHCFTWM